MKKLIMATPIVVPDKAFIASVIFYRSATGFCLSRCG
ncbi:Uncharacterised protein [Citrobacter koseri]|uniref:Uncharacterized protein n=1 Tax=Citrobacter koseri TaxID=545 RepID=A0A3S4IWJ4_CITKO|nr:Uncharacterised protein [Citrobacter koseri]